MGCYSERYTIDCYSIEDLIELIEDYKNWDIQKKDIKQFLKVKSIKFNFEVKEEMKRSYEFLHSYIDVSNNAINTISQNDKIDFVQTKTQIDYLINCYYELKENPKGILNAINENLNNIKSN